MLYIFASLLKHARITTFLNNRFNNKDKTMNCIDFLMILRSGYFVLRDRKFIDIIENIRITKFKKINVCGKLFAFEKKIEKYFN